MDTFLPWSRLNACFPSYSVHGVRHNDIYDRGRLIQTFEKKSKRRVVARGLVIVLMPGNMTQELLQTILCFFLLASPNFGKKVKGTSHPHLQASELGGRVLE